MKKTILLALLVLPLSLFAQKFGHFDSSQIISLMPEYTKAQQELTTLQKQYTDDLNRMRTELNKKAEEFDAQKDSLPANIVERRKQELQTLYDRIQQTAEDNQTSLQKASNEKMQAIMTKVSAAVKEIGVAGSYVYIMDSTAGIPYISSTLSTDVTNELKAKLGLK